MEVDLWARDFSRTFSAELVPKDPARLDVGECCRFWGREDRERKTGRLSYGPPGGEGPRYVWRLVSTEAEVADWERLVLLRIT